MSRCFPFPPPGRTLGRDNKEVILNDLIKLQTEKQTKVEKQKKKERKEDKQRTKEEKEKRRQRKEMKKERKERKKEKKANPKAIVKAFVEENICIDTALKSLHKHKDAETESDLSSLSEEHGHPVLMPALSSSPDSAKNSNKRMSESSPIAKAILLHLPSKKQNEFDSLAEEKLVCTTSGRTGFPAQNFCGPLSRSIDKNGTKSVCNAFVTPKQKMGLKYTYLLENLIPSWVPDVPLSQENEEWLFKDKDNEIRPAKRQKSGSNCISCSRDSGLLPSSEYLHQISVYALPYTVPY